VLPTQDASHGPDDEKILKYASELFRQLRITRPEPDSVVWDPGMKPDVVTVRFGEVTLPQRMRGRLAAADWGPLLAPAIIYGYLLFPYKNRGTLIRLILPLGAVEILLVYVLLQIFRLSRQFDTTRLLLATIAFFVLYAACILVLWIKWYSRSLTYVADQRAANTIGREVFVEALDRYGRAISATGYPLRRLHVWPTIGQRIERLQKGVR
jgi:hypothetical protein